MSPRPHGARSLLGPLVWVAAGGVVGGVMGAAASWLRGGPWAWPAAAIGALLGAVVGFSVPASSAAVAMLPPGAGPVLRYALLLGGLAAASAAGAAAVIYLFPLFVLQDVRQAAGAVLLTTLMALVVGIVVDVYERLRADLADKVRELEEVRLAEARLREQAARAKLAALQARINPHFFFNTLNTIAALLDEDPRQAESTLEALAELFRYTLRATDQPTVRLSDEIAFVRAYLAIERARLGPRLEVQWEVDPAAGGAQVPGLILQPLVENAVQHAVAPRTEGGCVVIAVRRLDGRIRLEVRDDGPGIPPEVRRSPPSSHGLDNVVRRLETLYGAEALCELRGAEAGGGASVRLELPYRKSPAAQAATGSTLEARP